MENGERTHLGDTDLRPVRSHGRLVSMRLVKGAGRFQTGRSYALRDLRMTVEELSTPHRHVSTVLATPSPQ